MSEKATPSRRGRLPAAERARREQAILDAALEELIERGYDGTTMLRIATRAGASKETLYSWFGSRDGLIEAVIARSADGSAARVREALERGGDPAEVLRGYATGLLTLLTGPGSIALNRAAMASPELAALLLGSGRHRIGPIVEAYLATLDDDDGLDVGDPAQAFELLYGLVIRDTQIRVLLGEVAPTPAQIEARAARAVDQFLALIRAR